MQSNLITIQATVEADIQKVWHYYTVAEHITQWNFATPEWHCPKAENDLQVGGKYAARMEAKDGSFGFDFTAVYDVVNPPHELRYTMADGRQVETHFASKDANTLVTTVFAAENHNDVALQKAGWQAILDNFKQYTEAN